uniref:Uncharacterized protein n=1 Tax=Helicotheca tamesis TaxID=374047 RepID=A0A7S2GYA9_9STRA|mmetsp:Transcript_13363/g.18383  ORF Transcript_13363/g.18383 Transcript_13363/m.18383 type:complete len:326 (+) Transcript_13363:107-1084(+)|eukprot:CAMPEP_0185724030 /NCGR_PEP_ID=MMETSP1171-20130828/646_1 /TAXON_ID=374046 /ORGANISM="Helicotheca tamensis, Strain CCMP826" /LENGTH=325 /DNA_ID=CAMNT_0028391803 /DNA_START=107 /DNA_END=1084 /DNA_ORIENTATION=-
MKLAFAISGTVVMAMSAMSVPNTLRGLDENMEKIAIDKPGPPPFDPAELEEDKDFLVKPEDDASKTDEDHRALAVPRTQIVSNDDPGGYDYSYFSSSFTRIPGLSGFYFDFQSPPRPLKRMRVKSYTSQVHVAYYDYNLDDDFYWKVRATELPLGTSYHSTSGSSAYGCYTSSDLMSAYGKVPVLTGFDLEFNGLSTSNRPLDQVQVKLFKNGPKVRLTVCFSDSNDDDRFRYTVNYALVNELNVLYHGYSTGLQTDTGGSASQHCYSNYGMVLSGFDLRFKYATRNIDRIGIMMDGSTCTAYFDDDNDDDPYEWNVSYHLVTSI